MKDCDKPALLELRPTLLEELPALVEIEQSSEVRQFIMGQPLEVHRRNLSEGDLLYRTIVDDGVRVGFLILKLEGDAGSVEFRRIVVTRQNAGIGQRAVAAMEEHCRSVLLRRRVWLDVFEFNERARHIYEKRGYRRIAEQLSGRLDAQGAEMRLLFYDKVL